MDLFSTNFSILFTVGIWNLDFEWSKRGWVLTGLDFEWDLKPRTTNIWNPDKWLPFCQKLFEIRTKKSGFWMVGTKATIAIAKARPFENRTIWNMTISKRPDFKWSDFRFLLYLPGFPSEFFLPHLSFLFPFVVDCDVQELSVDDRGPDLRRSKKVYRIKFKIYQNWMLRLALGGSNLYFLAAFYCSCLGLNACLPCWWRTEAIRAFSPRREQSKMLQQSERVSYFIT